MLSPRIPLFFLLFTLLQSASALTPMDNADITFEIGRSRESQDRYTKAIAELAGQTQLSATQTEELRLAYRGQIRVALRSGGYATAEATLKTALTHYPDDIDFLTLAGVYTEFRGRYEEAAAHWKSAVEKNPDALEARFRLIELDRMLGGEEGINDRYQWFVDRYNQGPPLPPRDMEWVGRACVRLEKYQEDGAQKAYKEALDVSPTLVSVLIAKGDVYLDRYNESKAISFYAEALKSNPESIEGWVSLTKAERKRGDFAGCLRAIDRALAIHPSHPDLLAMAADLAAYDFYADKAAQYLKEGYQTNPNHPLLLAVETTYAIREKREADVQRLITKIEDTFANPADIFFEIGECLERNYLFTDADRMFARAIESSPGFKRAKASRALLAARISPASTETAFEAMKEAFREDQYHERLHNMRNLFEERQKFVRLESEHCVLLLPEAGRKVYGQIALDLLEKSCTSLSERFGYKHSEKILVECYENPTDFSVRIAGLPGTRLAGVCFGNIVLLQAPYKSRMPSSNWGNVLHHEIAHTFTLALSDHRLPRWYTEGLSVSEEWDPGVPSDPIVSIGLTKGKLISVADLDKGFHHPASSMDVAMVYAQAGEVAGFLNDKFGFGFHAGLLAEFSKGAHPNAVLEKHSGMTIPEIDAAVRDRVKRRVSQGEPLGEIPFSATAVLSASGTIRTPTESELVALDAFANAKKWTEALARAEAYLEKNPEDLDGLEARAFLAFNANQRREARKSAEEVLKLRPQSYAAHLVLGKLDYDNKKWDRAVEHFLKAHSERPRYVGLHSPIRTAEEILRDRRSGAKLLETLSLRLQYDLNDSLGFLEVADLAGRYGREELIEPAIRQAILIDPYSANVQIAWGRYLLKQGDKDAALDRFQTAAELDPKSGRAQLAISEAFRAMGRDSDASAAAALAVDLDPTLAGSEL